MKTVYLSASLLATALVPFAPSVAADTTPRRTLAALSTACISDVGSDSCGFTYVIVPAQAYAVVSGRNCDSSSFLIVQVGTIGGFSRAMWTNYGCTFYAFGGMFGVGQVVEVCDAPAMPSVPFGDLLP